MPGLFQQFDTVKVVAIRGDRFAQAQVFHQRLPKLGDMGAILDVYASPHEAYEVECSDPASGFTIWLQAMYPDELELVQALR